MPIVQGAGTSAESGNNIIGQVKITNGTLVVSVLDLTSSDALTVAIVDGNGDQITSFGGGTQYTEDAAAAANPVGTAPMLVRADTPATVTNTDGDNVAQRGTNYGAAYVQIVNSSGSLIDSFGGAGGTSEADDADFVAGTTLGTPAQGVYESTPSSVTDGDLGTIGITQTRALRTAVEGSVAVTNAGLTELAAAINGSSQMDVNIAANGIGLLTTAAHDAAFGTAGSADSQVRSIQGIASMTPVQVGDNSGSLTVDAPVGTPVFVRLSDGSSAIATLPVSLASLPALAAGTNNIGDVDVLTLPATPAGTNAIGKLLPPDIDVTAHTNYASKYYTSTGSVTDGIVWSPAAGKRWHIVSMFVGVSAAATVTLEDDKAGGDVVRWKHEFAANGGMTINWGEKYPLASEEDAADLIVTTSAGNVYITCTGYEV